MFLLSFWSRSFFLPSSSFLENRELPSGPFLAQLCPCLETFIIVSLVLHSTHNKLILLGKLEPLGSGFPFQGVEHVEGPGIGGNSPPSAFLYQTCWNFPVILFVEVLQWSLGKPFGPFSLTGHDGRGLGLRASLSGLESRLYHFFPVSCGEVSFLGFSALDHPLRTFVSPPGLAVSTK